MSGYNPIATVKKINNLAVEYEKHLLDKKIKYIYIKNGEGNKKRKLILNCRKHNFMHLCGVKKYNLSEEVNHSKNAEKFFLDALSGKLNPKGIVIDHKFHKEKMASLSALSHIVGEKGHLCDRRGVYLKLEFMRSIRTSNYVLAIALKEVSEKIKRKVKNGSERTEIITINVPLSNMFIKKNIHDRCFKQNTKIIQISLLDNQYREKETVYSLNKNK